MHDLDLGEAMLSWGSHAFLAMAQILEDRMGNAGNVLRTDHMVC